MKNKTLIEITKDLIKKHLEYCTPDEIMMFKKMYSHGDLEKDINLVVDDLEDEKVDHAFTQCENTLNNDTVRPYLIKIGKLRLNRKYNPKYGDDRECACGHSYYRHFDTYEDMSHIGCKYCQCYNFEEATDDSVEKNIIDNLMKPRYELIEDYPGCNLEVGEIFGYEGIDVEFYEKYPKIFRKVNWYEDREEQELPKYLKFVWDGNLQDVVKVNSWLYGNSYAEEKNKTGKLNGFTQLSHTTDSLPRVSLNGWEPATEKEYQTFIKQQNYEK